MLSLLFGGALRLGGGFAVLGLALIALIALLAFIAFITLFAFQFSVLDFIIDILNCISQFFIIFYQFIFYFRNLPYCQVTGTLTAISIVPMPAQTKIFV